MREEGKKREREVGGRIRWCYEKEGERGGNNFVLEAR